jgi:hypothetical protein
MYQADNGRYTLIQIEALALVLERTEDGKLVHLGAPAHLSLEESLNDIRAGINETLVDVKRTREMVLKQWNRFQATKPFMEARELELNEVMWKGFELQKYESKKTSAIAALEQALYELTDIMLENDVTLKSLEDSTGTAEVKHVSLDDVKNLFDGFGKKE